MLGFFNPKIYLPSDIGDSYDYVVAHERVHIKRLDFIVKPVFFAFLAVHWFHPLMWLAYYLMNKDMELSCDEAAIKGLGADKGVEYSQVLLNMASAKPHLISVPLAFGEGNAKSRIKNALKFKRPTALAVGAAAVVVAMIGVFSFAGAGKPARVDEKIDAAVVGLIFDTIDAENDKRPVACSGEGHIIFGYDEGSDYLKVYGEMYCASFNCINGELTREGYGYYGSFVAAFTVSDGEYTDGKIEFPLDGADNYSSIKRMFPRKYHSMVLCGYGSYGKELKAVAYSYAEKYLEEQNKPA